MTGLDLERDALVEISCVVTDAELRPLSPGIDIVIRPPQEALDQMNGFVREMHTKSGLILEFDGGTTLEDAQAQVIAHIREVVPEGVKPPLGGNSVGTDKTFLTRDMPELIELLSYRVIDVSSLKELAKRWYPLVSRCTPNKTGGHRALGDIYDSIDELRYYRRALFPSHEPEALDCMRHQAVIQEAPTSGRFERRMKGKAEAEGTAHAEGAAHAEAAGGDSADGAAESDPPVSL